MCVRRRHRGAVHDSRRCHRLLGNATGGRLERGQRRLGRHLRQRRRRRDRRSSGERRSARQRWRGRHGRLVGDGGKAPRRVGSQGAAEPRGAVERPRPAEHPRPAVPPAEVWGPEVRQAAAERWGPEARRPPREAGAPWRREARRRTARRAERPRAAAPVAVSGDRPTGRSGFVLVLLVTAGALRRRRTGRGRDSLSR